MGLLFSQSALASDLWRCPVAVAPCGFAQPLDVGVLVEKPVGDGKTFSQGSGIYLGHGFVLTAAHVVKMDPDHPQVTVVIDSNRTPGNVVLMNALENVDLALIKLDNRGLMPQRRTQAGVSICTYNPGKSQPAVVISQGLVTRTSTLPLYTKTPPNMVQWTHMLAVGLHPGNSGGGVFDPSEGCLWGVVVQEISGKPDPKGPFYDFTAFTGAVDIWRFLSRYRG